MIVYRSADGGRTWELEKPLGSYYGEHQMTNDVSFGMSTPSFQQPGTDPLLVPVSLPI